MVNTNKYLKENVGNGSQCKGKKVKLKPGARPVWKNWDNHKVYTVSIQDVEYVEFCHYPKPPKGARKTFRLKPERVSATINFPLSSHGTGLRIKLGKLKVTQVPVNCNIAVTGHKLQGMSKDWLIVNSWSYTFENWVYVVLSRVRTRSGLFLNKKLDLRKRFRVPEKLLAFEERMKVKEREYLKEFYNFEEDRASTEHDEWIDDLVDTSKEETAANAVNEEDRDARLGFDEEFDATLEKAARAAGGAAC